MKDYKYRDAAGEEHTVPILRIPVGASAAEDAVARGWTILDDCKSVCECEEAGLLIAVLALDELFWWKCIKVSKPLPAIAAHPVTQLPVFGSAVEEKK